MIFLLLVAFIAGFVTVVSPCVLPVLPIVLGAAVGGDRRRPYLVIAGLILSFSVFTLVSYQIVSALHLPADTLRLLAVGIVALLGLTLLVPRLGLAAERRLSSLPGLGIAMATSSRLGGLVTGIGLGLVWAPCAGPILGAITSLAITQPGSTAVVALVIAYAIGAGLPMLAIAIGSRRLLASASLRRSGGRVQQAFGALILVTAGLMAVNADVAFTAWATTALPDWTGTLQTLERTDTVASELHQIGVGNGSVVAVAPSTTPGAAASLPSGQYVSSLPIGPQAPEFAGITRWLNSGPLTLASLRGKVVLIDFWTYSCINCIRTLPYVTAWYQKYAADGFVVIGVHSPEFTFEHDTGNVEAAIKRFGITYPVAQDNDFATWQAWGNQYWPADYLIDAEGRVRDQHFGEGDYDLTEQKVRDLLKERGATASGPLTPESPVPMDPSQTAESYIGTDRLQDFASPEAPVPGQKMTFSMPSSLDQGFIGMAGTWTFQGEYATADAAGDTLRMAFTARDVYLVMTSDQPATVHVQLVDSEAPNASEDVGAHGTVTVSSSRLYHLVRLPAMESGTLELTFDAPGVRAYAFTFGS